MQSESRAPGKESLTVVGGWYEEICAEPRWQETYGPGGRAAVALSGRKAAIRFLTYCPDSLRPQLEYLATTFGFELQTFGLVQRVARFRYLHWLRPPYIEPATSNSNDLPPIEVSAAENVIRYGFYEGDAIVRAKRAVYDPQNAPEKVRPFSENGSSADQLFIVCNYAEGVELTRESLPDRIVSALLKSPNTIGVALKCGWEGVLAASSTTPKFINATPTTYVHKIGSGDVFTAELAYGWMILGLDPIAAAERASVQVAYYANSASLPIPELAQVPSSALPKTAPKSDSKKLYDVYIAAPFFTYPQLAVVEELSDFFLDAGLRVFSPYHNVGLGQPAHVAKQDLEALHASRIVIAYIEDHDPGTVFEIGYARALDIPVLVYAPNLAELHTTMFLGSGCELVRDFTTAVYRAIWWAGGA